MKPLPLKLIAATSMIIYWASCLPVMASLERIPFPFGTTVVINRDTNQCRIESSPKMGVVVWLEQWENKGKKEVTLGIETLRSGININQILLDQGFYKQTFSSYQISSIPVKPVLDGAGFLSIQIEGTPDQPPKTVDINFGDLGRAYDFVVKNCGWRSDLYVSELPLEEPVTYDSMGNEYYKFSGEDGYSLHVVPQLKACRVQLADTYTLYSIGHGLEQPVLPWGPVYIYGFKREPITIISHTEFAAPPLASLFNFDMATESESLTNRVSAEINGMRFTLFGLSEAMDMFKMRCLPYMFDALSAPYRVTIDSKSGYTISGNVVEHRKGGRESVRYVAIVPLLDVPAWARAYDPYKIAETYQTLRQSIVANGQFQFDSIPKGNYAIVCLDALGRQSVEPCKGKDGGMHPTIEVKTHSKDIRMEVELLH